VLERVLRADATLEAMPFREWQPGGARTRCDIEYSALALVRTE